MRCNGYLILVRHGESRWNLSNKFTGWVDIPLSQKGIKEALKASSKLKNINLDLCFTSELERAQETLLLILAKQNYTGIFLHKGKKHLWGKHLLDKNEIKVYADDKLNERYYGKLQGMDKNVARKKFGKEKVFKWRRSFKAKPPGGESLLDTYNRAVGYFKTKIKPELNKGKNILVVAHGNSLRAIIKYLDKISDEEIPYLNLPTGQLIIYLCSDGKLVKLKHKNKFTRSTYWKKIKK